VDLLQLARDLPGLAGADLANIVNEAQLNAVRAGRQAITAKDMYAGVDRFTQVSGCGESGSMVWGMGSVVCRRRMVLEVEEEEGVGRGGGGC